MKFLIPYLAFNLVLLADMTTEFAGTGYAIEKYGFPVVFTLAIWLFFSKQNAERHKEQREFWSENNRYLREVIRELQNNYCGFKKDGSKHD